MRTIKWSSAFKRDHRKIKSASFRSFDVDLLLENVLMFLDSERRLPERYRDHPLSGRWKGYRECHLIPDLLLIYQRSVCFATGTARIAQ
jgi:mRNA interferase YafQ